MPSSQANGSVDTYTSILPPFIFPLPPQEASANPDGQTRNDETDKLPQDYFDVPKMSTTCSHEFATWEPDPLSIRLRSIDATLATSDAPDSPKQTATTSSTGSPHGQVRDTTHKGPNFQGPRISITPSSPPPLSEQTTLPLTILEQAASLSILPRFQHLLDHTTHLIQTNGPYHTTPSGTLLCFTNPKSKLSPTRFATSLAAAQDAQHHLQPQGPITTDLAIFFSLWATTTTILDHILDSHILDLEDFGWGVFGLAAGAVVDPSAAAAAAAEDELFKSHKQRLHAALLSLPSLNRKPGERAPGAVKTTPAGRVHTIATANRSVHICATMLVQGMREFGWKRVRWAHGVRVAEAWVAVLRVKAKGGEEVAGFLLEREDLGVVAGEREEGEVGFVIAKRAKRPALGRSVSME